MAKIVQKEGGWGDGIRFTEKGSWAMYTPYDVDQECAVACDPVWTALSGSIERTQGAENINVTISYPFFFNRAPVGNVHLTFTPSGNVNTTFTLDNITYPDLSFAEVAVKLGDSPITTDFSNVSKVSSPKEGGNGKLTLKM